MKRRFFPLPLLVGLLLLTRCSPSNSLSGSVSELFSLTFNAVDMRLDSEAFVVTYYFTQSAQTVIVVQLHVETAGVNFTPGADIDLSGEVSPGHPRTSVTHFDPVAGQSPLVLPPVMHGSLSLGCGLTVGQTTCGSFSMSFSDDGLVGSNRTLTGGYDGLLQDGEFPPDSGYFIDAGPWGDAGEGACEAIPSRDCFTSSELATGAAPPKEVPALTRRR